VYHSPGGTVTGQWYAAWPGPGERSPGPRPARLGRARAR
jgi:hypothetical protein